MIYVIVGPTGCGKTHLAKMLYDFLNNRPVLINADAFQVYQDMNIGTAKISVDDPLYSEYKLLDIIKPCQNFSVMEFQKLARKEIDNAIKQNRDVILVGGTGLYIRATLYDYQFNVETEDIDLSFFDTFNNDDLHCLLKQLDPVEANKIHPNNRKRVMRAISIIQANGESKTNLLKKQQHQMIYKDVKIFFINPPREKLYQIINKRVDAMIKDGLIDEVKNLVSKYHLSMTAQKAIGYSEIISFLENKLSLEEAIELIKKKTRNYAKRQITFFKHQFDSIIMYNNIDDFLNYIQEALL